MAEIAETVNNLQTQLTAVQAALDGNSNSGLFKHPMFNGLPNEDVNEWLAKFDRLSKFYSWSNAKKLGALPLLLGGSALAWYQTLPTEVTSDFSQLVEQFKVRFGVTNLEFIFRQELYSRKQGPNEPLSMYTEDIIRQCQRLSLSDVDMMNIFINGLKGDLKSHVILNQPKSFAEADNLARLRNAVNFSAGGQMPVANDFDTAQTRRIKELEGQVNLLMSLASQKESLRSTPQPVQAIDSSVAAQADAKALNNPFLPLSVPEAMPPPPSTYFEMQHLRNDIIAAIDTRLSQNQLQKRPFNSQRFSNGTARGRNLRTTDGQPVCNNCQRVGHVSRYCNANRQSSAPFRRNVQFRDTPSQQEDAYQPSFQAPRFQSQQPRFHNQSTFRGANRQYLNDNGPSQ